MKPKKHYRLCIFQISVSLVLALPTFAQGQETITHHTITKYIETSFYYQDGPFIQPVSGALDWKLFDETKVDDDQLHFGQLADYQDKPVTLYGYMFAPVQKAALTRFIFGPYPNTCPFHYHVRKNVVVEVKTREPIAFTLEPVLITGALKLATHGDGYFYELNNARLAK